MDHKTYEFEIKKQQRFINRLIHGRSEISEKISELTKERYSGLIGKFFVPNKSSGIIDARRLYFVSDIYSESSYVSDSAVKIVVEIVSIGETRGGNENEIFGLFKHTQRMEVCPSENLDEKIGKLIIPNKEAYEIIRNHIDSFLSTLYGQNGIIEIDTINKE